MNNKNDSHKCSCGEESLLENCRYIGIQSGKLELYNCPKCNSTFTIPINDDVEKVFTEFLSILEDRYL